MGRGPADFVARAECHGMLRAVGAERFASPVHVGGDLCAATRNTHCVRGRRTGLFFEFQTSLGFPDTSGKYRHSMAGWRVLRSAVLTGAATGSQVDFKLISSASLKTHPASQELSATQLWQEGPCLVYVARRLG